MHFFVHMLVHWFCYQFLMIPRKCTLLHVCFTFHCVDEQTNYRFFFHSFEKCNIKLVECNHIDSNTMAFFSHVFHWRWWFKIETIKNIPLNAVFWLVCWFICLYFAVLSQECASYQFMHISSVHKLDGQCSMNNNSYNKKFKCRSRHSEYSNVNDPNGPKWTENNNGTNDTFRRPLEIVIIMEDTQ